MKKNKTYISKKKILLSVSFCFVIISIVVIHSNKIKKSFFSSEYKTFHSPLTKHYLLLYRYNSVLPVMPGTSADASGFICLYDGNGSLLQESDIEMLQLIDAIQWSKEKVVIHLIADWQLSSGK